MVLSPFKRLFRTASRQQGGHAQGHACSAQFGQGRRCPPSAPYVGHVLLAAVECIHFERQITIERKCIPRQVEMGVDHESHGPASWGNGFGAFEESLP